MEVTKKKQTQYKKKINQETRIVALFERLMPHLCNRHNYFWRKCIVNHFSLAVVAKSQLQMAPANKTLSLFRTREKEGKKLFWPNFVFKQYTYPPHHLRCIMVYGVSHGVSSRHAETCGYY